MSDIDFLKLSETLHPLEKKVLALFCGVDALWEEQMLQRDPSLLSSHLSMALEWLKKKELLKIVEEESSETVSLTELGASYAELKNPPLRLAETIQSQGAVPIRELQNRADLNPDEKSEAIGALKKSGAVRLIAGGLFEIADPSRLFEFEALQRLIEGIGKTEIDFASLPPGDQEVISLYHRKRGKSQGVFRLSQKNLRRWVPTDLFFHLDQELFKLTSTAQMEAVTPQMLKEESWRGHVFRKYNIALSPPRLGGGKRHPYRAFLDEVKKKCVSMGFTEMRGPLVESEFWNMDALFMPQFHPAREIHDVYFVKDSPHDRSIPDTLISAVAAVHQDGGGVGSRGWRYPFDLNRTRRLILRSQGTAVSARMLGGALSIPGKYFSISRCFRYDQVDATHAPDFYQVEGIVLGDDVHFRTLLGLLTLFAREIAHAKEVQFRPAYFPFTEPSVEMHVRHPKIGWMELGGAGLFRPEVTGPFGVKVPVIAWGLGLDRMAMVALGLSDIRDLFSSDLSWIREQRIPI